MRFAIRPAQPADAASVADISLRGWAAAYADILPPEAIAARAPAFVHQQWHDYVADIPPTEGLIVASDGATVVGFARFGPCEDDDLQRAGELYGLYVEPELIGRGIGHGLFIEAASILAAAGFATIAVWTFAENGSAITFYEREGLARDGVDRPQEDTQALEVRLVGTLPLGR